MELIEQLVSAAREGVDRRRGQVPLGQLESRLHARGEDRPFSEALARPGLSLIAEFKRRSPGAGEIAPDADVSPQAGSYERGGAAAVSVLTDQVHFGGSLDDLRAARASVSLPVLRKDFIVTEFQVREARAHGADAILLIAAAAPLATLGPLRQLARELGMTVLFEVHEESELDAARACEPDLLGVNARDLRTLEVHPGAFARIAA